MLQRILRKVLACFLLDELLVFDDDLLQRIGLELVVKLHLRSGLYAIKDVLKLLLGNIQNHVSEHLDQTTIGIICKAGIIAELGERFHGLVVQAEVQNRIHHAGH